MPETLLDTRTTPTARVQDVVEAVGRIVLGKPTEIRLALACFLAGGHLLIEDRPGVGKTTLVRALAKVLGIGFKRIQFTSDLLPADIIGVSIFDRQTQQFRFHHGPLFSEALLADELNRATPKTQSALLEAMAEGKVTVDGETRKLPPFFFVAATQNPMDLAGTFPLPDSELDRFLMRISLGYPSLSAERTMLEGTNPAQRVDAMNPIADSKTLATWRADAGRISVTSPLLDYVQRLVVGSREHPEIALGLSPRASMALLDCARAWAYLQARKHCLPDDVKAVFVPVAGHRLEGHDDNHPGNTLAQKLLDSIAVERPG